MSGCVLFTDLVGFTVYTEVVGDEAAVAVLDRQATIVDSVLSDCADARVVKEIGDGLMIWFGSPPQALVSAVALREAVVDAQRASFPLSMRMGMHHGDVMTRGDDLVGHNVNVASRVADVAGPGELLVSEPVLDACPDHGSIDVEAVGPVTVKGVSDPVWLHRVGG